MPRAGLLAPVIWLACAGLVWANSEAPVAEGGGQTAVTAAPTVPTAFDAAVAAYRAGDVGAAFAQFLILARAEMPQAQFNLALLYRQGEGVPQNRREALYWAWRARIGGVAQAGALVSDLLADVSADQRDGLADRLQADLAPARAAGNGRMIAASALVEAELRAKPDAMQVYVWYSIAAALSAQGAAKARDESYAALSPDLQSKAEDAALAGFQEWCARQVSTVQACLALE